MKCSLVHIKVGAESCRDSSFHLKQFNTYTNQILQDHTHSSPFLMYFQLEHSTFSSYQEHCSKSSNSQTLLYTLHLQLFP